MGGVEALPAGERLKHLRPQSEDLVAKMLDIRTPFNSDSGSANPLSGLPEAKLRKGGYTPLEKCLCQEWGHKGNRERGYKTPEKFRRYVAWGAFPSLSVKRNLFSAQYWVRSRVAEDFFDRLPAEGVEAAEGSSASGGEPQGLLQSLKGLDDLEADLLGASRPGSGPGKTTVKEPPAAQTPLCTATPVWKRKELTFEEDSDDLMAALGLGSGPGRAGRQGKKAEEEEVRPARAKLDEFLGRGSMTRTLEEPDLGERREVKLAKEYQKQLEKEEGRHKDDFVFGAYQPTVASIAKGRPARRQPLRFSAEKNSELKAERLSKAPLSASQSPAWGCRNRSGWLGLKREEFFDLELSSPAKASPAGSSRSPAAAGQPGPARQLLAAEEAAAKTDPVEEEEDWLSAALARKKAQAQAKAQERTAKPSEVPGEGLNPGSPVSPPAASPGAQPQAAAVPDKAASTRSSRLSPQPWACCYERRLGAPAAQPHEDATDCQARQQP
ncbi:fas-binding factor 1 homolog [Strix uralensis]|uniref:fas-binding factor 1 homolog n=1 Tax=Strix uralensis TaxID=36305 RepID=UPI003DA79D49